MFRINNLVIAEELANNVFLKVFRLYDESKGCSIKTYVHQVTNSIVIDHYRKVKQNVCSISDFVSESGEENLPILASGSYEADANVNGKDIKVAINSAMENLNTKEKNIVNLYFSEQRTYEEMADMLGMPLGSIKVTLMRAKAKLTNQLTGVYSSL